MPTIVCCVPITAAVACPPAISYRAIWAGAQDTGLGISLCVTPWASYTLTILNDAPNPGGAARFVEFLLSAQGQALLKEHGVDVLKPKISGDGQTIPPSVRAVIDATQ